MKSLKCKLTVLLCCLLVQAVGYAQTVSVTGKVTSGGMEMPGVTITVKGGGDKTHGTITGIDGSYSIQVDAKGTLVFSFVGYQTVEQPIAGRKVINVDLKETATQIDEVVIAVPYGTAKKSTFTGSASVIDKKLVASSQVSSVSKALQGTVSGLQSFSASGQPGEDATILIRGVGSANASNDPLYVVDGVPYDGALSSISSQDIANITVLKDAAAASLYGSRAANGVIMITTKQGNNSQAPSIELSAKYGFSSRAVRDYDQLSINDYYMLQWESLRNGYIDQYGYDASKAAQEASSNLTAYLGINPYGAKFPQPVDVNGKLLTGASPLWDDSWEDALSQDAHYVDLSARVSGGSDKTKYYFSLGYLDDQGAYICSGFKRYSLRANIVSDLRKWLQVGLNVSGTHSIQNYPKQDDTAIGNVVLAARNMPGFYPVFERNHDTGEYLQDEKGNRIYDYGDYRVNSYRGYNFAQSMFYDKNEIKRDAASIRGHLLITPLEGLSYKMSLNIDYNSRFSHDYSNPTYGKDPAGSVSKRNTRTTGLTFNNVVNWNHTFAEKHDIRLMVGQEYYEFNTSNFGGSRSNVITDGYFEPDVASTLTGFSGNSDVYKLLSYFGSAEYAFKQKYFVSASVRTDGSSRFHPDNRWGTFWSFGGSWKIIQEDFLESARNRWLSNLTLRMSYGAQGNDNLGTYYAYKELYSIGSFLGESTLTPSRLETRDLTWETNLNFNVGLDFGLFNNRLTGTIEFFNRASKDLLFSRDLIPSSGFSSVDANIGKVRNYGWEFSLAGYPVMTDDWTWKLSVNATTYKNKIVELPNEVIWNGSKKWVENGSLNDFWMYEWAGINPENGHPQWYRYEENGNKVKTEDYSSLKADRDKVNCGNALPKVSGGFQSDLTWKDLSLSALFTYGIGGKIYNRDKIMLMGISGDGDSWSKDMLNRWTPENRYTDVPRLSNAKQQSSWTSASDRWLVDRSYLRLKTVTLNYNLPKKWLQAVTIHSASVFVQAENLLTFAKQQGLDPEQSMNGVTYFRYPTMKTISFGINVKL